MSISLTKVATFANPTFHSRTMAWNLKVTLTKSSVVHGVTFLITEIFTAVSILVESWLNISNITHSANFHMKKYYPLIITIYYSHTTLLNN